MKTKSSVAVACFLPGRAKDLSAALYVEVTGQIRASQRKSIQYRLNRNCWAQRLYFNIFFYPDGIRINFPCLSST